MIQIWQALIPKFFTGLEIRSDVAIERSKILNIIIIK